MTAFLSTIHSFMIENRAEIIISIITSVFLYYIKGPSFFVYERIKYWKLSRIAKEYDVSFRLCLEIFKRCSREGISFFEELEAVRGKINKNIIDIEIVTENTEKYIIKLIKTGKLNKAQDAIQKRININMPGINKISLLRLLATTYDILGKVIEELKIRKEIYNCILKTKKNSEAFQDIHLYSISLSRTKDYDEAIHILRNAIRKSVRLEGMTSRNVRAISDYGTIFIEQGRARRGASILKCVTKNTHALPNLSTLDKNFICYNIAVACEKSEGPLKFIEIVTKEMVKYNLFHSKSNSDKRNSVLIAVSLCNMFCLIGDYDAAEDIRQMAHEYYEKDIRTNPYIKIHILCAHMRICRLLGQYEIAEEIYNKNISILKNDYIGSDILADCKSNYACVLIKQHWYPEAEAICTKLAQQSPRPELKAEAFYNLGEIYSATDRLTEALVVYRKAYSCFRTVYSPNHPAAAMTLAAVAKVMQLQGHIRKSTKIFQTLLRNQAIRKNLEWFDRSALEVHCAKNFFLSGDTIGAQAISYSCYYERLGYLGEHHPDTIEAKRLFDDATAVRVINNRQGTRLDVSALL